MGGFIYSLDSQRGKAGCQCLADRKLVLLIADGLADRPVIDYDYKTPLEYANTPNMDRLAKGGLVGQLDPISPGVRPGSDVANLRGVGVLGGEKFPRMVCEVDPKEEGLKLGTARATDGSEEAKRTAQALNEFVKRSHEALREHPLNTQRVSDDEPAANIVITRGAGTMPALPSLKSRNDLRGACIAGTAMIKGLALAAGLDLVDVKGATGGVSTEHEAKEKKKNEKGKDQKINLLHFTDP